MRSLQPFSKDFCRDLVRFLRVFGFLFCFHAFYYRVLPILPRGKNEGYGKNEKEKRNDSGKVRCDLAASYRKSEDHQKVDPDNTVYSPTGMDHLFHIYLLGWYHAGDDFFNEADKVYVAKHKNLDKAINLLPFRF